MEEMHDRFSYRYCDEHKQLMVFFDDDLVFQATCPDRKSMIDAGSIIQAAFIQGYQRCVMETELINRELNLYNMTGIKTPDGKT